jgi:drug/metabolite transporter (DMT)-like permease
MTSKVKGLLTQYPRCDMLDDPPERGLLIRLSQVFIKKEKSMKPAWLLLISVCSATLGQIFFKKGVFVTGEITLKESVIGELFRVLLNPFVFSGLAFYVISTILWLIALSKTSLSFVYPFASLVFVLVMLSARFVFLEPVPPLRYVGIAVICVGFLLSSLA